MNGRRRTEYKFFDFEYFLKYHESECYLRDYGHGAIPYKELESVYKDWYFVAVERMERLKVFYYRGDCDCFKMYSNDLLKLLECSNGTNVWTVGHVPCLFTVDFSADALADAIRRDFFLQEKDTKDVNLLNALLLSSRKISFCYFNMSRTLDFDFSSWLLKRRKETMR